MTDLEKEADNVASLQYDYGSAYNGYLAGANRVKDTRLYSQEVIDSYEEQIKSLREQLAKERELRKELVEVMEESFKPINGMSDYLKFQSKVKAAIQKSKDHESKTQTKS